jgi:hypothetical protein
LAELNKLLQSEKCIELSQSVESITTFEVPIVGKRIENHNPLKLRFQWNVRILKRRIILEVRFKMERTKKWEIVF